MNKTAKYASIITLVAIMLLTAVFVLAAKKECNNGQDDDGDGAIDLADGGCVNKGDNDESNCGDGVCEGGETASSCYADCGVCGNNLVEGPETCDGTDLDGETCVSQGHHGGTLACAGTCDAFDTSGCYTNTCSDTDGGFVASVQGTVSGDNMGSPYSHTDTCGSGTLLTEWWCQGGTVPESVVHDCNSNSTTTCSNGACV